MKDRRRKRSKDSSKQISNNIRQLSKYLIISNRMYRANLLTISLLIAAAYSWHNHRCHRRRYLRDTTRRATAADTDKRINRKVDTKL